MVTIRALAPGRDYPRAADLLSLYWPRHFTAEGVREREEKRPAGSIQQSLVAVGPDDQPVAYGWIQRAPWTATGEFSIGVAVDPAWRRQGVGSELYGALAGFGLEHGGATGRAYLKDDRPGGLMFAEQQGLTVVGHEFTSLLDLAAFDETPFADLLARAEREGFRFFSLAELEDAATARERLHTLHAQTAADVPGTHDAFPTLGAYEEQLATSKSHQPAGILLAADGDEWVGLAVVTFTPGEDNDQAYNAHTGVLRSHRGRGVAQALKLLSVRAARAMGAKSVRTDNDETNAPMLAINRKLGYVPQPGWYRLRGPLLRRPEPAVVG
jgi:GNAT superfamily N-acetyltransferase